MKKGPYLLGINIFKFWSVGYTKNPKGLLPNFHKKTHFKAMESMSNNEPGVLNIEDGSIDPILQDLNLTTP